MAAARLRSLIGYLEKLSGGRCEPRGTDRQLLDDFSARHDETAFTELVARHGPLVLRVCRRVLHHEQDAEDAFQATFLVLAQCAESIRKREALANWLHGVAYRTAMKAKRSAARRRNHEARLREQTSPNVDRPTWDDVQAVLDEEIQRLPASFRSAFVLCVLQGKTTAAAAAELGCKEGTVASRLSRARQRLQQQLSRRGIELTALLAALSVAEGVGKAALPGALAQSAIRSGILAASGGTAAGLISAHVAALAAGVTRAMFLQKAKIAAIVLLTVGLFAAGAGALTQQILKAEEKTVTAQPPVKPRTESAKAAEDTIEVTGRVLDPDGRPVAKARLYQPHWFKDYYDHPKDGDTVALGVTDATGHFRVPLRRVSALSPQPFQLLAAADGFGLNWVELPKEDKQDEVTLRLVKDQVVRGRLVNTEGKPIVGVTVGITGMWSSLAGLPRLRFVDDHDDGKIEQSLRLFTPLNKVVRVPATDKDGRFEIAGLGTERTILAELKSDAAVMPPFFIATRLGFDPKSLTKKDFGQAFGQVWFGPSFEWVVLPPKSLEGTVREADSRKPVVGATVWATGGGAFVEGVTDAKGHYQLTGLIRADTYHVMVYPKKTIPLLSREIHVDDDHPRLETATFDVELLRGVIVTGRVLDKVTGKGIKSEVGYLPLPDNPFVAKAAYQDCRYQQTSTDLEGRFRLVTLPGPGVLLAKVSGLVNQVEGNEANSYRQAEFNEVDRRRVKVEEKPGTSDRIFAIGGGGNLSLNQHNACKVVDLEDGAASVACTLTVRPGITRTLHLQDSDGKPLTGVIVSGIDAMPESRALLKTATCPVLALEPKQPRQLAFLHPERKLFAMATVRGDDQEPRTLRLAPLGVIRGRFLDGAGQPLADAVIYLTYSHDSPLYSLVDPLYRKENFFKPHTRTDKEGRFRLEGVFPGLKFMLSVRKGRDGFVEETKTEWEPLKAGETLDRGDVRMKARNP
jgi:RNA polymerase sigma factor (sigma-70 family)